MRQADITRLEKLQALREAGALTEEEFQAEKAALVERAARPPRWPIFAGLGAVALGGTVALGLWAGQEVMPEPAPTPTVAARPTPSPTPSPVVTAEQRLADAFLAATGHRGAYDDAREGGQARVTPARLLDLPFGPVLLAEAEIPDGCHACTGSLDIYYLAEEGGRFAVRGRYRDAVHGAGFGAAPDWAMTDRFTANPAIWEEGGYTAQGYTATGATVTELAPSGPATSDVIRTGYGNAGAVGEDSDELCEVKGTVANVVRDRSFDVVFTGGRPLTLRYEKRGGRFVAVDGGSGDGDPGDGSAACPR
jgi:hypothetical protein